MTSKTTHQFFHSMFSDQWNFYPSGRCCCERRDKFLDRWRPILLAVVAMRALLRNRQLDGSKWILQVHRIISANHCSSRIHCNNHCRSMAMAAVPTEATAKKKREKIATKDKKPTKRSIKVTVEHSASGRTGMVEVAEVMATAGQSDDDEQSLSPWLRQLWKGNGDDESSVLDSVAPLSMSAANDPCTAPSPETNDRPTTTLKQHVVSNFERDNDDDDDDDLKINQPQRKRSGGSGNDFDGNGYGGLGAGDDDGDDDDNVDDTPPKERINSDRFSATDKISGDPKETWPIDPNLYPFVRVSLTDVDFLDEPELLSRDTGLSICTLGTSAGGSCRLRANSATVVRSGSYCYLIDAGEGVQRQFMISRLRFNDIRKIFITHMHADHVFGLPGLLLSLQTSRLNDTTPRPVEIYGPVGLYNYVAMALALTCTEIRKLHVYIYELHGGTQRSMRFVGNRKAFPEFQHKCLTRKSIPQNADGTWTLVEPMEIITPELAASMYSQPQGFSVKAAEIHHIPELQCFGYTMQEPMSQPRSLNVVAARKLGVTKADSFRLLKSGFSVMNDNKSRLVHADEVCGQPIRPRKVTVLGDCCLVPPAMEALAMNSDVLVHEATLCMSDTGKKVIAGGHSTSAQAAIFANKVKAQVLIMNHLPKTLNLYVKCKEWLLEAESRIRGPTKIQLGYDHLEVLIPRNGFGFSEVEASQSLWPEDRVKINDTIERVQKVNETQNIPGWR